MTTTDKIEALNKICKGTLSFTHFTWGWEISSYGKNTFFKVRNKLYKDNGGYLKDESFKKLVEKAYSLVFIDYIGSDT